MKLSNKQIANNMNDIAFVRGFMGPSHTKTDQFNISNTDNIHGLSHIVSGIKKSPMFNYLLNLGNTEVSDAKSMGFFNSANIASKIAKFRYFEEVGGERSISLPINKQHRNVNSGLVDTLKNRQSSRYFSAKNLSLNEFSDILKFSFGLAARQMVYDDIVVPTRHYGSGGGLYPIETIILINKVKGITPGAYAYQPYSHSLYRLAGNLDATKVVPHGSFDLINYSFLVLYKYDINRNMEKYGELALLISLIEVGLMSQNLSLIYTSYGLSGCQIAGFDKHYCEQALGLDGVISHIVFADICGHK